MDIKNTISLLEKHEVNGEELEYLLLEREINEEVNFLLIDVREEDEYKRKKNKRSGLFNPTFKFQKKHINN